MDGHQSQRHVTSALSVGGFRGRVLALIGSAGLACIGINAFLCYAYVVRVYRFVFAHSPLPVEITDGLYHELLMVWMLLTAINLLIFGVIAIWVLLVLQRVAGPLYHMQKVIDAIASGDLEQRLHLRHKDELQGLAASFNRMVDRLEQPPGAS